MPQFEQVSVFSSLIFWSLISFVIFLFLLKKFAFPPILKILEERESKIKDEMKEAEELKVTAENLKRDFEAQMQTAHDKAETIVQLATEEARKIQEKTLSETQAKCRQMQKEAVHEIQVTRSKTLSEIQGYISSLTILATETVLKRSLNEDDKKRLVDQSIEDALSSIEQKS